MYELLNITNKFKGKHIYYCNLREREGCLHYQAVRKLYVRLVKYIDNDIELVCMDTRVTIPMNDLIRNKTFSMMLNDNTAIISTEKQEVERFLKKTYIRTIKDAWCNNDYAILNARHVYNKLVNLLKKL